MTNDKTLSKSNRTVLCFKYRMHILAALVSSILIGRVNAQEQCWRLKWQDITHYKAGRCGHDKNKSITFKWDLTYNSREECLKHANGAASLAHENECGKEEIKIEIYCESCAKSKDENSRESARSNGGPKAKRNKSKESGGTESGRKKGNVRDRIIPPVSSGRNISGDALQSSQSDEEKIAGTILNAAPGILDAVDKHKRERNKEKLTDQDVGKPEGFHSDDARSDDEWVISSGDKSDDGQNRFGNMTRQEKSEFVKSFLRQSGLISQTQMPTIEISDRQPSEADEPSETYSRYLSPGESHEGAVIDKPTIVLFRSAFSSDGAFETAIRHEMMHYTIDQNGPPARLESQFKALQKEVAENFDFSGIPADIKNDLINDALDPTKRAMEEIFIAEEILKIAPTFKDSRNAIAAATGTLTIYKSKHKSILPSELKMIVDRKEYIARPKKRNGRK